MPVWCELHADLETPISTFMKMRADGHAFLLESVEGGERIGRYSFIGSGPVMTITSRGDQVDIRTASGSQQQKADVLEVVRDILHQHQAVSDPALPRFTGGPWAISGTMWCGRGSICPTAPLTTEGCP